MTQVMLEQEVMFGGWDLTAQTGFSESAVIDALDASVFKARTSVFEPGLKGYGISGEGFWSAGDDSSDEVLSEQQRVRNIPLTIALEDGSVGSQSRSVLGMIGEYQFGESHGALIKMSYAVGAMAAPTHGTIMHNASASGNVTGTGQLLGSVLAGQSLHGILHVFDGSGSFVVKIQSNNGPSFSAPTDHITFATVPTGTARTYEWKTVVPVSDISDAYWRVTATNPATRDFAVIVAIQ